VIDPHGYRAFSTVKVNGVARDVYSLTLDEIDACYDAMDPNGAAMIVATDEADRGEWFLAMYVAAHAEMAGAPFEFAS
jgi:hypothetical protein